MGGKSRLAVTFPADRGANTCTGLVNPCLSAGEHTLVCDRSGSGAGTAPSYPPGVGDCGIPATLGADLAVILR